MSVDLSFGIEWSLLEATVRAGADPSKLPDFDSTLAQNDIDWGELIEQALRHKLLPLIALHLTAEPVRNRIPWPIRLHLDRSLAVNRHFLGIYRHTAARVVEALAQAGVTTAGTKGIALESTIYGADGSRYMNDLDFMVQAHDRVAAVESLERIGFVVGDYNAGRKAVVPHSRREEVIYRLNPDHIPIMALTTGDTIAPAVRLDIAYSLTWARSEYDVPVSAAFATLTEQAIPGVPGTNLPVLAPDFQFIFTALHLFREAWLDRWLGDGDDQDVNLAKFGDVLRLWQMHGDGLAIGLLATIEQFDLVRPMAWVTEHLDRLFGTSVTAAAGLSGRLDETMLSAAYAPGGGLRHWKGTMRDRLVSKHRRQLLESTAGRMNGANP
ncbi:MAG TPA: hypothetical protein DGG94_16745 [Micromonosporaceae bacterium]|nr:hypothetical protein [Micromonosporaceae bacterium]HCU51420.1 hypothetical protein [Micromonosporaceae bacterium]